MPDKELKKNAIALITVVALTVIFIILAFAGVIDFVTAGLLIAVMGVIFYFVLVGINYKHSIYGGRFFEHYDGKKEKNRKR